MKKDLTSFAHLFGADTGMDRRDPFVSAWSDALVQVNKQRNRKFIATDVTNWLLTMKDEASDMDASVTVDVWLDSENDLFCVCMTDAGGSSEFCVAPPRNPKTKKERTILNIINGGAEAHDAFRKMVIEFCDLGSAEEVVETESDHRKEMVDSRLDPDDMSDEEIEAMAKKLDKSASAANNQHAAYLIEVAASRLRELKNR